MADIFRTQSGISERVTRALEVELVPNEQAAIKQPVTSDIEAYKLYVQGRYFWRTRTADGLRRSADYFERAIARDPGFARAYSGLADAYVLFIQFRVTDLSRREIYGRARTAAEKALALDSTLAEAHASLGEIVMYADWDWADAEARFRRAIELDPDYATARQWYSELLLVSGRTAEAIDQGQLAVSLDPVSPVVGNALAFSLLAARRYPEAAREYQRVLAIDSTFGYAVFGLALTALGQGKADQAIDAMRRAGDTTTLTATWMRGAVDPNARPTAHASLVRQQSVVEQWAPEVQAWAWAALHDADRAFAVLDQMALDKGPTIPGINSIPLYDSIKADPRFEALERRIGWR
jgi:Flp pilus assembly protein TadD